MLRYFEGRAIMGVEHVSAATYRRTVTIDDHPGGLELSSGSPSELLLRVHLPHWEGLIHDVQRARRIFNLDADVKSAVSLLSGDPMLGPLMEACPGVRPPGTWDPFETGVRAIVGQLVSVAAANTITARVVQRHGTRVPGLGACGRSSSAPSCSILRGCTRCTAVRSPGKPSRATRGRCTSDRSRYDGRLLGRDVLSS
jgi:AraC family transcriptional regulator of adaptative response / DNA-3-methyladenine glycosylase II